MRNLVFWLVVIWDYYLEKAGDFIALLPDIFRGIFGGGANDNN